jgi:hypothetical protein
VEVHTAANRVRHSRLADTLVRPELLVIFIIVSRFRRFGILITMGRHKDLRTMVHAFVRDDLHWSCEVKLTHSSVGIKPRTEPCRRNDLSFACTNCAMREVWGIDYRNQFLSSQNACTSKSKGETAVAQARARTYKLNGGRDILDAAVLSDNLPFLEGVGGANEVR